MPGRIKPAIALTAQAERDAYGQAAYLAADSLEAAARFAAELRAAFERLRRFPGLGRRWPTRISELAGLRRFKLSRLPILIFYRLTADRIEIIRILHHRRDLPAILWKEE